MISFLIGGLFGIGLMCLLQINRDNELKQENKRLKEEYTLLQNASDEYEDELQNRINKAIKYTKEQLEYSKKDCVPARGIVCEKLLKILGGDVDDE